MHKILFVGVVLGQPEDKKPYAIYYIRKNLTPVELNYTVTEKEFLAVVHTINKFQNYINGYQVFVHNDHSTIHCLMKKLLPMVESHVGYCCYKDLISQLSINLEKTM